MTDICMFLQLKKKYKMKLNGFDESGMKDERKEKYKCIYF